MNIIRNLIIEAPHDLSRDLAPLWERAYERCRRDAEGMNLYPADAFENLSRYAEHEAEPAEIASCLCKEQQGDWRAVVIMATKQHLEAEVEADIAKLERAIHEASLTGYEARRLYSTCACGWTPHSSETELTSGILFEWKNLDAAMIRVSLSAGAEVWIDLAWVD
ncbi:hypothetical protein D3C72_132380 [compost metagenome]